jgi:hypothetical protein
MGLVRSLGIVGWAWRRVLPKVLEPGLWLPFLVVAAVQVLLLVWLLSFHRGWAQPLAAPLLRSVAGEGALHYPQFFSVLPVAFARLTLVQGVLLSSLLGGIAVILFARAFGRDPEGGSPVRRALARYPSLVLYTALVTGLVFVLFSVQRLIPGEAVLESRMLRWGTRVGFLLAAVVVESLFIYGTAWIVLRGRNVFGAIPAALGTAAKAFLPTLFLVAIPALAQFPFNYLEGRGDVIIRKFQPEIMAGVIGMEIAVDAIIAFFLVGTITFVFLWRQEPSA